MISSLLLTMLLHPFHETVAEIEWNEKTKRVEVALRISILDQQWIEQQSKPDAKARVWAVDYLKKHFQVGRQNKRSAARYHWVGRQTRGSHVWWYFEIELENGDRPETISQRILFDRHEGYVNRVILLGKKSRRAVTLTIEQPEARLSWHDQSKN